jgi:hypothetical protein
MLSPGTPVTLEQPQLLVENKLPPGRYRFQLVVLDDSGNESDPADLIVSVQEIIVPPPRQPGRVLRPDMVDRVRLQPGLADRIRIRRPQ